jgi:metallophosphoesterase (TIGR00282 family)
MPIRRVLFLGDVCSEAGRNAVRNALPKLREEKGASVAIVNVENAAGGYGVTPRLAEEILRAGADCMTTGDHAFDRKEAWVYFQEQPRLLRPLNYPPEVPGSGHIVIGRDGFRLRVISLLGRVFLKTVDCPFRTVTRLLEDKGGDAEATVVDFHAEATAEKKAMGWFLDGKVAAVLGTHTHVQTADERILPQGTAYITDVGMCGAFDSVLGMKQEQSLRRLLEQVPLRLHPATENVRLNGVVVDIDQETGRAVGIERFDTKAPAEPPAAEPEPEGEQAEAD